MARVRPRLRSRGKEEGKSLLRPERDLVREEREAAERAIRLVDDLVSRYEPREAEEFIRTLHAQLVDLWKRLEAERVNETERRHDRIGVDDEPAPDLSETGTTKPLSPSERADMLRRMLTRRFERRRRLIAESLTADQVADALGVSPRLPNEWRTAGRVLAVPVDEDWLFPAWQFDPAGPSGVVDGLPDVLAALSHLNPVQQYSWLSTTKPLLDGLTPVEMLRNGYVNRVSALARGAGVG